MVGPVGEQAVSWVLYLSRIEFESGPLRPSTCQSVRMDFLALTPGVHSVGALTLTDIETGYAVNLRSVVDIVVHEPPEL